MCENQGIHYFVLLSSSISKSELHFLTHQNVLKVLRIVPLFKVKGQVFLHLFGVTARCVAL